MPRTLRVPRRRRRTRQIQLGSVAVGGGAPVTVQSMTKTDPLDRDATIAQILDLQACGCDIVRVAVPSAAAIGPLRRVCERVDIPVVADIHFDHRLALAALRAGVDGLRINPGNIGGVRKLRELVAAARDRAVPIRVGVNSGSVEPALLRRHGGPTPEALVESALGSVAAIERAGYDRIKISVKASDVPRTVQAYRLLARRTHYPLHLGVTESGTAVAGTVRSSVAVGMLLAEGIGDTLRISLTEGPALEVKVGLEILRCLGLRPPGPNVISCPTCGRVGIDVVGLAHAVEAALERHYLADPDAPRPLVAVMGCMVNGPGEAREADVAVAGGKGKAALYVRGRRVATVAESEIVDAVLAQVRDWQAE